MNVLTIWLAVDRSDRENGCMRVIRGSHKGNLAKPINDNSIPNAVGIYTHREEDLDQSQIVNLILNPGGN